MQPIAGQDGSALCQSLAPLVWKFSDSSSPLAREHLSRGQAHNLAYRKIGLRIVNESFLTYEQCHLNRKMKSSNLIVKLGAVSSTMALAFTKRGSHPITAPRFDMGSEHEASAASSSTRGGGVRDDRCLIERLSMHAGLSLLIAIASAAAKILAAWLAFYHQGFFQLHDTVTNETWVDCARPCQKLSSTLRRRMIPSAPVHTGPHLSRFV